MSIKFYSILPLILQRLIWLPVRVIFLFFGHYKVEGVENLKKVNSSVIFTTNHTSELDPVLVAAAMPFWSNFLPFFYVSREKKFYKKSGWRQIIYGGTLFKMWGAYPAYVGLNDYEKSLIHHVKILRDGKQSVCIFPEGKKSTDGNMGQGKMGAAYLAQATGSTIVPVAITGAWKTRLIDFLLFRKRFTISIGKPLTSEYLFHESARPVNNYDENTKILSHATDIIMNSIKNLQKQHEPVRSKIPVRA